MTEFWVSTKKYYCQYCNAYISDNKTSRRHHESGNKHKNNVKEFLENVHKKKLEEDRQKKDLQEELKAIERAAEEQYNKDIGKVNEVAEYTPPVNKHANEMESIKAFYESKGFSNLPPSENQTQQDDYSQYYQYYNYYYPQGYPYYYPQQQYYNATIAQPPIAVSIPPPPPKNVLQDFNNNNINNNGNKSNDNKQIDNEEEKEEEKEEEEEEEFTGYAQWEVVEKPSEVVREEMKEEVAKGLYVIEDEFTKNDTYAKFRKRSQIRRQELDEIIQLDEFDQSNFNLEKRDMPAHSSTASASGADDSTEKAPPVSFKKRKRKDNSQKGFRKRTSLQEIEENNRD